MPLFDYTCPTCASRFDDVNVPDSDTVVSCSVCEVACRKEVAMPAAPSRFISSRLDDMSVAMHGRPGLVKSRSDVVRWEETNNVDLRDRSDLAVRQGQEERKAFNHDSAAVRRSDGIEGDIRWRMEQEVGKDMLNRVEEGLKYAATTIAPAGGTGNAGRPAAIPVIARV